MGTALEAAQDLTVAIGDLESTVDTLRAENDSLIAQIAELTGKLLPEVTRTIVGSSAQPGSVTAFLDLEAKVGKLGAWRIFIPGTAPSDTDVHRIKTCIEGKRIPYVSVTGGTDTVKAAAAAKEFVRRVKPLGGTGWITFGHEPTQKYPDRQGYINAKNAFYQVIKDELTNWRRIDIFMLWDIEADGDRHPDKWRADLGLLNAIGVDAYDQGKRTPQAMLAKAIALAEKYQLPLHVTETSTVDKPDDPSYKPAWIAAMESYCRDHPRIACWLWFNSKVGPNAPEYGWFVTTSDASTSAFKDAVTRQW
jgi:hypothetical protein